eukprot:15136661-Heterocapsa_arctica.AAC.1
MMKQVSEIKYMANSIRDMMSRWVKEEPEYHADKQEVAEGLQTTQAQAEEDIPEPQVRTLSALEQTIEDDIENIVGYR